MHDCFLGCKEALISFLNMFFSFGGISIEGHGIRCDDSPAHLKEKRKDPAI